METRAELRLSPPFIQISSLPCMTEQVKTQVRADWLPASCQLAGTLYPQACQPVIAETGFRAREHHLFLRGQQQPGSLVGRQVGSEEMKKQSSGVLLKNSAEIVGFLGGLCCPSKRRQLPVMAGRRGPQRKVRWAFLSPSEAAHGKSGYLNSRCERKMAYSRSLPRAKL